MMYEAFQMRWFEDQSVVSHTTGSATTATVSGAGQAGQVLTISALSGTLNAGDIITIAGVNGVNRLNFQSLGVVAQFVVTANVASCLAELYSIASAEISMSGCLTESQSAI